MVGVATRQIAFWNAVIRTDENLWFVFGLCIGLFNRLRQGLDVCMSSKYGSMTRDRLPFFIHQGGRIDRSPLRMSHLHNADTKEEQYF